MRTAKATRDVLAITARHSGETERPNSCFRILLERKTLMPMGGFSARLRRSHPFWTGWPHPLEWPRRRARLPRRTGFGGFAQLWKDKRGLLSVNPTPWNPGRPKPHLEVGLEREFEWLLSCLSWFQYDFHCIKPQSVFPAARCFSAARRPNFQKTRGRMVRSRRVLLKRPQKMTTATGWRISRPG